MSFFLEVGVLVLARSSSRSPLLQDYQDLSNQDRNSSHGNSESQRFAHTTVTNNNQNFQDFQNQMILHQNHYVLNALIPKPDLKTGPGFSKSETIPVWITSNSLYSTNSNGNQQQDYQQHDRVYWYKSSYWGFNLISHFDWPNQCTELFAYDTDRDQMNLLNQGSIYQQDQEDLNQDSQQWDTSPRIFLINAHSTRYQPKLIEKLVAVNNLYHYGSKQLMPSFIPISIVSNRRAKVRTQLLQQQSKSQSRATSPRLGSRVASPNLNFLRTYQTGTDISDINSDPEQTNSYSNWITQADSPDSIDGQSQTMIQGQEAINLDPSESSESRSNDNVKVLLSPSPKQFISTTTSTTAAMDFSTASFGSQDSEFNTVQNHLNDYHHVQPVPASSAQPYFHFMKIDLDEHQQETDESKLSNSNWNPQILIQNLDSSKFDRNDNLDRIFLQYNHQVHEIIKKEKAKYWSLMEMCSEVARKGLGIEFTDSGHVSDDNVNCSCRNRLVRLMRARQDSSCCMQ